MQADTLVLQFYSPHEEYKHSGMSDTDHLKTAEVGAGILNNSLPLIWTDTFFPLVK